MKKLFVCLATLFCAFSATNSQAQDVKGFFEPGAKIFWIGVDYSQAKLINDGTRNADDFVDKYFQQINELVINEPKNYKVIEAFGQSELDADLSYVNKVNAKADPAKLHSSNLKDYSRFTEADIQKAVKEFNFNGKKGYGVVFIVEAMNKTGKKTSVWVTGVDMGSKKVLFTERMLGDARGFGNRNYWAGSIADILKDINKKQFKAWRSKYGS
ncbi:hypothetical protein COR50_10665 [Chitinophaga caeni]|uniref:DUF4410 domain-containing protein n=1 Tax=Chitinophaga caeni TaxID=2029983 RepID=A0A291QUJ8_9BACT|nr:hypothetical protein [Chitinophaga caeni]ATL47591.1 hypothetical protein COR50_10665 [Chitinophaga caeni]